MLCPSSNHYDMSVNKIWETGQSANHPNLWMNFQKSSNFTVYCKQSYAPSKLFSSGSQIVPLMKGVANPLRYKGLVG